MKFFVSVIHFEKLAKDDSLRETDALYPSHMDMPYMNIYESMAGLLFSQGKIQFLCIFDICQYNWTKKS